MITYYGILDDGRTIDSTSLDHLSTIPYLKYLFKIESGHGLRFTPIAKDGSNEIIGINNFELVHIGEDIQSNIGFRGRLVTVRDKRSKINYQKQFTTTGYGFLTEDLLPFLNKLDEIGSFEMYDRLSELDNLKAENSKLKETVQALNKQLEVKNL